MEEDEEEEEEAQKSVKSRDICQGCRAEELTWGLSPPPRREKDERKEN